MKAILYFVAAGIALPRHLEAAKTIASKTDKRVVFRNASANPNEKPEANEGVAGSVPSNYSSFPRYSDDGKLTNTPEEDPEETEVTFNAIGLPDGEGCPEDREQLKEALEANGIAFHGNASTEKLAALYMSHFYPVPDERDSGNA